MISHNLQCQNNQLIELRNLMEDQSTRILLFFRKSLLHIHGNGALGFALILLDL